MQNTIKATRIYGLEDLLDMKNSRTTFLVISLFVFSLCLNLYNNDFDYHLHRDEPKKVTFIKTGTQDFMHPTLMLKISKAVRKATGEGNENELAVMGRNVSAFMGACIAVAAFLLARQILSLPFAWLSGLSVAVSPILVVHAHYLKEDVYFTAPLLFALLFLIKRLETRKRLYSVAFGIAYGLALSAQYKATLLLAVLLIFPFVDRHMRKRAYAGEIAFSLCLSAATFLLVNYNIFIDLPNAYKGLSHEIHHIQTGHSIHFQPWDDMFSFHFKNSLIPGLTLAATILATLGYVLSLFGWKKAGTTERLLLLCVPVLYFAHEVSPLKPAPDFMRYMIPIAPLLIIFAWTGVQRMYRPLRAAVGTPGVALPAAALFALLLYPAYVSANLVANLVDDTRLAARDYVQALQGGYRYETYGLPRYDDEEYVLSAADVDIAQAAGEGTCHIVASSMEYDKYYYGARYAGQDEVVYDRYQGYQRLFRHPYTEIKPKFKTFAFSNPTIRIVNICAEERP
jgi:4-amino-4-deoxy-L-arabinose transferase-like glycosyltransferase